MTRIFMVCLSIAFSITTASAQNVTDQIDAVYRAQQREQLRQDQYQRALADQQARMAVQRQAERNRDRLYQDQLRTMELEQRRLQVQRLRAQTAREGDFIDRELKRIDAETEMLKSQADSNRNVSEGTKSYLTKAGDALNK